MQGAEFHLRHVLHTHATAVHSVLGGTARLSTLHQLAHHLRDFHLCAAQASADAGAGMQGARRRARRRVLRRLGGGVEAYARWAYVPARRDELPLQPGQRLLILDQGGWVRIVLCCIVELLLLAMLCYNLTALGRCGIGWLVGSTHHYHWL